MNGETDSLSVLVIDENPDVLTFFARLLDVNCIRALVARNAAEAIGIAERSYVPIDLILANVLLPPDPALPDRGDGPDLVDRIRLLRPHVPARYMSASVDSGVIRIELLERGLQHMSRTPDDPGLVDAIRNAAAGRRVRTAR
jgi:CheY-like chemotaxis protein